MSENSTPEERTEMPTDRRMGQLRKDGTLYLSNDLTQLISLVTGFYILETSWNWMLTGMENIFSFSYAYIARSEPLSIGEMQSGMAQLFLRAGLPVLLLTLGVSAASAITVFLQTGWNVKEKKIHFQWSMLNPVSGLKRIFSMFQVAMTGKALVKIAIILPIGFFTIKGFIFEMVQLMNLGVLDVLHYAGKAIHTVFWKIVWVFVALAVADYLYGRFNWLKNNRMTKEEVKDERKSVEGDEATKRKIQQKAFARLVQKLKKSVPKADVVITNPTHYAIALQYDRSTMKAPTVVAKGKDFMALRIREIAKEAGVPIVERKPLARALYASCEVDSEIPYELFRAVAEILAYVYRLKGGSKGRAAKATPKVSGGEASSGGRPHQP